MKKTILYFILSVFSLSAFSQVKVNDEALQAHNRRMVYMKWGDFKPDPKYVLGVQVSLDYAEAWGWLAPKRNKEYREGADLRPLSLTGEQTMRYALALQDLKNAEMIEEKSKILGDEALQEIAYFDKTVARADPIYKLYFKEVFKPLLNFNKINPFYPLIIQPSVMKILITTGIRDKYIEEMDILKDRLNIANESDMERGQRLILYHQILDDFRSVERRLNNQIRTTSIYDKHLRDKTDIKNPKINTVLKDYQNDYQLMKSIINKTSLRTIKNVGDYEKK